VDHEVHDQDRIKVAGLELTAISIEGHSPDSICYLVELGSQRHLFSGDVLFYGGIIGLINFPGSSMDGYRQDIKKLAGLQIDGLFPGHLLLAGTHRRGYRTMHEEHGSSNHRPNGLRVLKMKAV
jgi:glyoxylase-like metal-dependent hydrolase (beta-lactamase superfamily II)